MSKIEIDDAMVERALKFGWPNQGGKVVEGFIRDVLDVAFNPPPEPEIEVTKAMLKAGRHVWNTLPGTDEDQIKAIYTAMERQRLKDSRPFKVPQEDINSGRSR